MTLHQLIINNLAILEKAPEVAAEIDDKVMRAIDTRVAKWASRQTDWWEKEDYEKNFCQFGPKNWPINQEENVYKALYCLGHTAENDDEFQYNVSALCGAVPFEFGIWFGVDATWITRLVGRGTRPKGVWQKFLASQLLQRPSLHNAGFRLIHGDLFLPVHLLVNDLANAYPDALDDAFVPLDEALSKLEIAHSEIDAIVSAAADEFGRS